jgi:YVTN family beta-propeller protein
VALLFGAIAILAAAAASAGAAPLLLTGNYDSDTVSVIDTGTNEVVGEPIALGAQAGPIAIVPGGDAYVAEPGANSVAVIDLATRKVLTTIPVGGGPEYLAVSPDGRSVYVADQFGEEVTFINTLTNTSSGSVPIVGQPTTLAVTPDGKTIYVGVEGALQTIDVARREVVGGAIAAGKTPRVIAFTPNGSTAYVSDEYSKEVEVFNVASRTQTGSIPMPTSAPWGLAVSPDGKTLYVAEQSKTSGSVIAFSTADDKPIGTPVPVGSEPFELALTPNGKTLYVAAYESKTVTPVDTATLRAAPTIPMPGLGPWQVAIAPDLSPTAAFAAPSATAGEPATFNGSGSSDPDGTVSSYAWAFGDGAVATGVSTAHTYAAPGTPVATLSVTDNEGCGAAVIYTGRTALCGGNAGALASHPVTVAAPPILCAASGAGLRVGRVIHNRGNGTVRLQVKIPAAGSILLFGNKVHAVTRKAKAAGSMFLTIHARVELNKRLKKTLRAPVRFRLSFTPTALCSTPSTLHRSVALLRKPRPKKHHPAR